VVAEGLGSTVVSHDLGSMLETFARAGTPFQAINST